MGPSPLLSTVMGTLAKREGSRSGGRAPPHPYTFGKDAPSEGKRTGTCKHCLSQEGQRVKDSSGPCLEECLPGILKDKNCFSVLTTCSEHE